MSTNIYRSCLLLIVRSFFAAEREQSSFVTKCKKKKLNWALCENAVMFTALCGYSANYKNLHLL